jgi:hypothetical protein
MTTNIPRARVSRRLSRPQLPARRLCHKAHCACGRRCAPPTHPRPACAGPGLAVRWLLAPVGGVAQYVLMASAQDPGARGQCCAGRALRRPQPAAREPRPRARAGSAPAPLIQPPLRHGPPIPGGGRGGRAPRRLGAPHTARFALRGPRPSAVAGSLEGGLRPVIRPGSNTRTRRAMPLRVLITPPAPRSAR